MSTYQLRTILAASAIVLAALVSFVFSPTSNGITIYCVVLAFLIIGAWIIHEH